MKPLVFIFLLALFYSGTRIRFAHSSISSSSSSSSSSSHNQNPSQNDPSLGNDADEDDDEEESVVQRDNNDKPSIYSVKAAAGSLVPKTTSTLLCTMYSKKCYLEMYMWRNVSLDGFSVECTNSKIIRPGWIDLCKNRINLKKKNCSTLSNNNNDDDKNYVLVFFNLYPKIVGKSECVIRQHLDSSNETLFVGNVIVTRPDRFIDKIQDIYIIFFSVVIAICMGVLLDPKTLLNILRIPISVAIGFIAQYLFMPLVTEK